MRLCRLRRPRWRLRVIGLDATLTTIARSSLLLTPLALIRPSLPNLTRSERNGTSGIMSESVSDQGAKEMLDLAKDILRKVEQWLRTNHPELIID
jgi:hypothetical protein